MLNVVILNQIYDKIEQRLLLLFKKRLYQCIFTSTTRYDERKCNAMIRFYVVKNYISGSVFFIFVFLFNPKTFPLRFPKVRSALKGRFRNLIFAFFTQNISVPFNYFYFSVEYKKNNNHCFNKVALRNCYGHFGSGP